MVPENQAQEAGAATNPKAAVSVPDKVNGFLN
jgi:hypothetical protein